MKNTKMDTHKQDKVGDDIINALNIKVDNTKVAEAANKIKQLDLSDVKTVGGEVQQKISTAVSSITSKCKTLDCGEAGKALVELNSAAEVRLDATWVEKRFLGAKRAYKSFVAKYDKASSNLEKIVDKVGDYKEQLEASFEDLQQLIDVSKESFFELEYYVEALKECEREQSKNCELLEIGSLQSLQEQQKLQVYRRRLETLQASRVVLYQTVKESMVLMITNRNLIDDMQYTVDNIIPLWKAQIITATNAEVQKRAVTVNRAVRDSFNTMLVDNAKRISENSAEILKSSNESLIKTEALEEVSGKLDELTGRLQENYLKTSEQFNSSIKRLENLTDSSTQNLLEK